MNILRISLLTAFGVLSVVNARAEEASAPVGGADPKIEIEVGGKRRAYTLSELKQKLKVKQGTVFNPQSKTTMEYDGFLVSDVMKMVGASMDGKQAFKAVCLDGYVAQTKVDAVKKLGLVLMFHDRAAPGGWPVIPHGEQKRNPAPYYIIGNDPKTWDEYPWPYQVAAIVIAPPVKDAPKKK